MIRRAKTRGALSPEVVAAYASLFLHDDAGLPITPAPHHMLWMRLLCDERIKKLLIIAPPESAKTTWVVSAYVGCRIGFYPEQSVIIGSASESIAEKRSLSLRTTVETPEWKSIFRDVRKARGMKWETVEWSVAPDNGTPYPGRLHPTLSAYGTGGGITGSRADLVIADDLLDYDNSRTAHQRNLVETWVHNSLLSRRKARIGRVVIIGTSWHHEDMYNQIRRNGDYVVCHVSLLSDEREVYATLQYPDTWQHERIGEPISGARREHLDAGE